MLKRHAWSVLIIIFVFGSGFTLSEFIIEDSFATTNSQTSLAVGVTGKDMGNETSVGSVYIFGYDDNDDYYLTKTMTNPHELSHGQFGQFIAYHEDNKLAISAPWKYDKDHNPIGEIYLLDGTTGELLSTISNPNPYDNHVDEFGISVAFVGNDKIAVGAPVQPSNNQFAGGMVYVFDVENGNMVRSITDPNPQKIDGFGHAVAFLGDGKIAIGIPGKDVKNVDFAGAVSIFDANTGSLVKTIKNPEPDGHDEFGKFIASDIDNNRLLVGAHHRNVDGKTSAGTVYLFDADTASLRLTIPNPDPDDDAYFGKSVLLTGNKIVVGAPGSGTFEQGSVYIFDADTGKLLETIDNPQRIRPSEFGYTNEFGLSLAFDKNNNHLVIGDPGKIVDGTLNAGGVYIYDFDGSLIQSIDHPDPIRNDSFGHFVTFVGVMGSSLDYDLPDKKTEDKPHHNYEDSSHSENTKLVESVDSSKVTIPSVFAKEDYMTLDRQNYSDGDVVIMDGFIEKLRDGHFFISITVNPSGEVRSMHYGKESNGYFGTSSRIIASSWDDGIYKIIVSGAGKEFAEIFGVNYVLTKEDIEQHRQEQDKVAGKQVKKLVESFVYVEEDTRNYVQGGLIKISGFVHLDENDQTRLNEQITLKVYAKNSQIVIHEAKTSLNEYGEFSYFLDTSDDTKWDYTTQDTPPPFGTPRGFYYAVAEYVGLTDEAEFSLKATVKQEKELNGKTEQASTLQPSGELTGKVDLLQPANYDNNDDIEEQPSYLEWVEGSYSPTGTSVVVKLIDPDKNKDSNAIDSSIIRVHSGSEPETTLLPVTETGTNTGIFEGKIFYTTDKSSSTSNSILVADGLKIAVTYKGDSLFFKPSHVLEDRLGISDNTIIKNTGVSSPYKQMKNGALAENVLCNDPLEKIYTSGGHPACVKPSSVEKLIQRGYGSR